MYYNNGSFNICTELGVKRLNSIDYNFGLDVRIRNYYYMIFCLIYYPITLFIFYIIRNNYAILRMRSFLLIILQSFGQVFIIGKKNFFCLCLILSQFVSIPIFISDAISFSHILFKQNYFLFIFYSFSFSRSLAC